MTGIPMPHSRGPMIKDAPDHHDAELVLRLYDLRREASLREARRFITSEFWPTSAAELVAISRSDHPGRGRRSHWSKQLEQSRQCPPSDHRSRYHQRR